MSNYTPTVEIETVFQGDKIRVRMRRLRRKDMQKILPFIHPTDDGDATVRFEDHAQLSEVMGEIIPEYVEEFSGLKDADGNAIGLETVVEEIYFTGLFQFMVQNLMDISNIKEVDEKNSGGPSGDFSEGTDTSEGPK